MSSSAPRDPDISLDWLKSRFRYDPTTGSLSRTTEGESWPAGHVLKWRDGKGYIIVNIKGRDVRAHRVVWFYVHGCWPNGYLDHINGDRTDNRIENLREATLSENALNRGDNKNNTSGVKGVSLEHRKGKPPIWVAQIGIGRKKVRLGRRKDFNQAVALRKAAEKKYFGEFARL